MFPIPSKVGIKFKKRSEIGVLLRNSKNCVTFVFAYSGVRAIKKFLQYNRFPLCHFKKVTSNDDSLKASQDENQQLETNSKNCVTFFLAYSWVRAINSVQLPH